MEIRIITEKISKEDIKRLAQESFGDMVKAVVDIEREIMAVGGELHSDAEKLLLENGSQQKNLWGINIYPDKSPEEYIEFKSLINIRPKQNNRTMIIQDLNIQKKIKEIAEKLIY